MSGDSKPTDGPVSRLLNRRIASAIASAIIALQLPLTPNMLSLISFLTATAAAVLIALGHFLAGGILVQASSILDGVDGIVARKRGVASRAGGFLDTMLDRYADTVIYLAIAYAASGIPGLEKWAVLAAVAAVSGDILVSYLHTRGERDAGVHPSLVGPLDSLASRDVRLLVIAVLTAVARPFEALAAVAFLSHVYVAVKSASIFSLLKSRGA